MWGAHTRRARAQHEFLVALLQKKKNSKYTTSPKHTHTGTWTHARTPAIAPATPAVRACAPARALGCVGTMSGAKQGAAPARTEQYAATNGKRILEHAGFGPSTGNIPTLSAEEVRRCTLSRSTGDGRCAYWSVLNALPDFKGKSPNDAEKGIRQLQNAVYEEVMDHSFGLSWETKGQERVSHEQQNLLVSNCVEVPRMVLCTFCDRKVSREAAEAVEFFVCPRHAQKSCSEVETFDLSEDCTEVCRHCDEAATRKARAILFCGHHAPEKSRVVERVALTVRDIAPGVERYIRTEWAFPPWLAAVAWDTETTIIVWEPAPQGRLQVYVNNGTVGVYVGTSDGRQNQAIHLLYHDGSVRNTEELAAGAAAVWERR